ncbi:MAG: glycosyltransferase family 2 protein [Bacteroidota bacterium]
MKNPKWIHDHLYRYSSVEEVPEAVFSTINANLDKVQSKQPLVSVVISAYNEEVNILKTISSLSRMQSKYPFEILVVNNNSDDRTQETLDRLNVRSVFQPIQGWGPARQMGMENAAGKYVLTADADAIYPPLWLEKMTHTLDHPEVVCVYGRYSFIAEAGYPRWQLFLYEKMKDAIAEVRHLKRPYLNAYGISMGVKREHALKIGYVMHVIRGEDGRMCFDLMKYGKVKQVKESIARPWTFPRTLQKEGSLANAVFNRVKKEIQRLPSMFYPMPVHDTKTSTND